MEQTAKRSHHSDKVSSDVPQRAPHAMCSARDTLSRAAVFALATVHARTCDRLNALTAARQSLSIRAYTNAASVTSAVASVHETNSLPLLQQQPLHLPRPLRLSRCSDARVVAPTS